MGDDDDFSATFIFVAVVFFPFLLFWTWCDNQASSTAVSLVHSRTTPVSDVIRLHWDQSHRTILYLYPIIIK